MNDFEDLKSMLMFYDDATRNDCLEFLSEFNKTTFPNESILDLALENIQLNQILKELTKDYCRFCPEDYECCQEDHYDSGMPNAILTLQKMEAKNNGWKKRTGDCEYVGNNGCFLEIFKSPLCIATLCINLEESIQSNDPINGEYFCMYLRETLKGSFDENPEQVLENMSKAIEYGNYIIG